MDIQNIAFIGLGHMGSPMAMNLLKAGIDLAVYNRSDEKMLPLIDAGAKPYRSVEDITKASEIIFIMLSDDSAVSSVFDNLWSLDLKGKLFINMSTISPNLSIELARQCEDKGASYLEAPVSGSVKPATDGTLIILAAGQEKDYERAIPFFEKLGKLSLFLGEVGTAANAKLAINYYMSVVIEGLAETVLFAGKNGIDKETMMLIVNESACGSPMSKMKTPSIVKDDYPAAFPLKHMYKDVGLVKDQGLDTAVSNAIFDAFRLSMDNGDADKDLMAVIRSLSV